jgi:hypothetical protein
MDPEPTPRRGPWMAISVATVIAVGIIGLLSLTFFEPIDPDCWEWCGLGRYVALAGISLVSFVWLAVVLVLAWRHRARTPKVAALSAAMAATGAAALAVLVLVPWSPDSYVYQVFQLVALLAIGVALPATWRMAAGSSRRPVAVLAAVAMAFAVAAGLVAYVALGTTWWTDGPTVQWVATIAWSVALVVLVLVSWTGSALERAALGVIGLGAVLEAGIGILALGFHVTSGGLAVAPSLLAALGWGLLASAWARPTGAA